MLSKQDVLEALTAMRLAGLDDFGRWPKDEGSLAAMVTLWHSRLVANGIGPSDVKDRTLWYADRGKDFPSLSDFMRGVLDSRPFIRFPVITAISETGVGTVACATRLDPSVPRLPVDTPPKEAMEFFGVAPALPEPSPEQTERAERKTRRAPVDPDEAAEALAKVRRF